MKYRLFLSLAVLFLGKVCFSEACDGESLLSLANCTKPIVELATSFSQVSDLTSTLEVMCSSGAVLKMLNCVEQVFESCRNVTEIYASISSLMDFGRMRASYTYICDNVGELSSQANCISNHGQKLSKCISDSSQALSKMFSDKIKSDSGPEVLKNFTQELQCRTRTITNHCFNTNLATCGNAAKVLTSFTNSINPPICDRYANFTIKLPSSDDGNTASTFGASTCDDGNTASTFGASTCVWLGLFSALVLFFKP